MNGLCSMTDDHFQKYDRTLNVYNDKARFGTPTV